MTCTMRACALTLLAMARDAWAFVAAVQLRGSRPAGATCASVWLPVYTSAPRCAFTRVAGCGGDVHARGHDASDYRVAREVGRQAKARFKGSITHLEKPKVCILNYPTMGESDGASL